MGGPKSVSSARVGRRLSTEKFFVIFVRADPEPRNAGRRILANGAMRKTDTNGPQLADPLEVKRGMLRIGFQKFKVFAGELLYLWCQSFEVTPEATACAVTQSSVVSPRLCSSSASDINLSSLPSAASRSISRSQACQSYSANQARNAASSCWERFSTSRSNASTLVMTRAMLAGSRK